MGGKSRKTGGISLKLIQKIANKGKGCKGGNKKSHNGGAKLIRDTPEGPQQTP